MRSVRGLGLGSSLLVLCAVGCDRSQPVEPFAVEAASTAAAGPKVNAPSNTNLVAVSENRIDVNWQDNSTNETGFEVHRSTNGPFGTFTRQAVTAANVISYADNGLDPATQYCYQVRAVRTTGSNTTYSTFSNTDCESPLPPLPPPGPPAAPSWLTADGVGVDQIVLQWIDNSNNEDGFRIERCVGTEAACAESDFTVVWTTGANAGTNPGYYADVAVGGITYTYRVRAFNSAGDSPPSNKATATACFPEDLCGAM